MWKLDVIGAVLCVSDRVPPFWTKFPTNSMQSFFRSLSATASEDNVVSVNTEEARDIIQGGEGEKAAEMVEQKEEEEEVVLQKDVFPKQQVDYLKAWVSDASPSDRLRLMKHIVDLQAQILNLHTE